MWLCLRRGTILAWFAGKFRLFYIKIVSESHTSRYENGKILSLLKYVQYAQDKYDMDCSFLCDFSSSMLIF